MSTNNLRFNLLKMIRDEKLDYLNKKETAKKLNQSMDDIKKTLTFLQEDGFIEYEPFTFDKWKIRITADGCRLLEGKK